MNPHTPETVFDDEPAGAALAVIDGTAAPADLERVLEMKKSDAGFQSDLAAAAEAAALLAATAPKLPGDATAGLDEFLAFRSEQAAAGRSLTVLPAKPVRNVSRFRSFGAPWLALAACLAVAGVLAGYYFSRPEGGGLTDVQTAGAALAPRGDTKFTNPTLVWSNAGDTKYDVWVLPRDGDVGTVPALFTAKNVRSPVGFSQLKPAEGGSSKSLEQGKEYRVLVCFASAGRHAGVPVAFRTAASATAGPPVDGSDPASVLKLARQHLADRRPADAIMVLESLPSDSTHAGEAATLRAEAAAALPAISTQP